MRFGKQIRLAGAVVCIIGAVSNTLILTLIGLLSMASGVVLQVDNLDARLEALEPKQEEDDNVQ